ncbi:hypothetical protein ACFL96_18930 [Thermoproteota archaeon]
MKCNLCTKETRDDDSQFCWYHEESYKELEAGYNKWQYAYGELDWLIYLEKVARRPETGVWVKECCALLKKEYRNIPD